MSQQASFADPTAATRFRDIMRDVCLGLIKRERPPETYAVVQSIDRANRKAVVRFPGETVDITLPMGPLAPTAVGDSVRIKGMATDRHIDVPVTGLGALASPNLIGTDAQRVALVGPTGGMTFWTTDTKLLWVYDGVAAAWRVPYPLGRLVTGALTSNSAVFAGSIIYPLLSPAVSTLPNRKLRVAVHTNVSATVAGLHCSISCCDSGGTIATQAYRVLSSASLQEQITCEWAFTQVAALSNYQFRLGAYGGANLQIMASGTAPTYIHVYDEGPA